RTPTASLRTSAARTSARRRHGPVKGTRSARDPMAADTPHPGTVIYPFLRIAGAAAFPKGVNPALALGPVRKQSQVGHLFSLSSDPNELPAQRWGIVRTDDADGERLEKLVAPLAARRQREQGDRPPVVYKVARGMGLDAADEFVRLRYQDQTIKATDRPR